MPSRIVNLKLHVAGKIGESCVHAISRENEVDQVISAVFLPSERELVVWHGQLFVGHPLGDFDNFLNVGAYVARVLNNRMKAVEHRAAGEFGPARAG